MTVGQGTCYAKRLQLQPPDDTGDGQNEFTFSNANPGVLTMNFKAKVTPNTAAAANGIKAVFFTMGKLAAN